LKGVTGNIIAYGGEGGYSSDQPNAGNGGNCSVIIPNYPIINLSMYGYGGGGGGGWINQNGTQFQGGTGGSGYPTTFNGLNSYFITQPGSAGAYGGNGGGIGGGIGQNGGTNGANYNGGGGGSGGGNGGLGGGTNGGNASLPGTGGGGGSWAAGGIDNGGNGANGCIYFTQYSLN